MGRVDDDFDAVEQQVAGEGVLREHHVATARVLELLRAADVLAGGERAEQRRARAARAVLQERLELRFLLVRQLEAVAPEDLDAVVLVGIVARADDDAGVGAHAHRELGDGGRRDGTAQDDPAAHRADARGDRRLQHVPREPGVRGVCVLPRPATKVIARPSASAISGDIG